MKKVAIIALFALAGCVGTFNPQAVKPVSGVDAALKMSLVQRDLTAAANSAQVAGDKVGFDCFSALQVFVNQRLATPRPQVAGVFSTIEAARIGVAKVEQGIPEDVHVKCAPVIIDAQTVLIRLEALIGLGIH